MWVLVWKLEDFWKVIYIVLQRLIKGITPDIKSARSKAPPKAVVKEMQMSESSARLLKNASFLTQNSSFNFPAENPWINPIPGCE